jgi:hypothetical protein
MHDRGVLKYGPLNAGARLRLNLAPPSAVLDQISLRECNNAAAHTQQIYDGQVLGGLRHHAFVRCHNEQHSVNPSHARQHVLDKIAVTRNINNPNFPAVGQRHPPETKVDGHLARLLFL